MTSIIFQFIGWNERSEAVQKGRHSELDSKSPVVDIVFNLVSMLCFETAGLAALLLSRHWDGAEHRHIPFHSRAVKRAINPPAGLSGDRLNRVQRLNQGCVLQGKGSLLHSNQQIKLEMKLQP